MTHFYESVLIDTTDGFQFKTYANEHPEDFIICKPKYIPVDKLDLVGMKKRFLFSKQMNRFNLFAKKSVVIDAVGALRTKYPHYIRDVDGTFYFGVPRSHVKETHDAKLGLKQLLAVPKDQLDVYLTHVVDLIEFLALSGVGVEHFGITHSTLLGNYTPGTSDIDIIVFGVDNGWRVTNYLQDATHEKLAWKTEAEWREYYQTHRTSESSHFTEDEYVAHLLPKRYEGNFGGNVFTIFVAEEKGETWCPWGSERYEQLGTVTMQGDVVDDRYSIVRPGYYGVANTTIVSGHDSVPISKVVSYSIPFLRQARKGDRIECCGVLEKVTPTNGEIYYRVVVGYFDTYMNERREQEYLKRI